MPVEARIFIINLTYSQTVNMGSNVHMLILILFVILHQAVRYLMRFQSEYTCGLLNVARHAAFGKEAATMVLKSFAGEWPKVGN